MKNRLIELENVLIQQGLWQSELPSPEALASTQPFAIDTLTLPQWLQFIFIPKMRALLETGASIPSGFAITPYAEEFFKLELAQRAPLLAVLRSIDELG